MRTARRDKRADLAFCEFSGGRPRGIDNSAEIIAHDVPPTGERVLEDDASIVGYDAVSVHVGAPLVQRVEYLSMYIELVSKTKDSHMQLNNKQINHAAQIQPSPGVTPPLSGKRSSKCLATPPLVLADGPLNSDCRESSAVFIDRPPDEGRSGGKETVTARRRMGGGWRAREAEAVEASVPPRR